MLFQASSSAIWQPTSGRYFPGGDAEADVSPVRHRAYIHRACAPVDIKQATQSPQSRVIPSGVRWNASTSYSTGLDLKHIRHITKCFEIRSLCLTYCFIHLIPGFGDPHCVFLLTFWQAGIWRRAVLLSCNCSREKLKSRRHKLTPRRLEMRLQLVSAARHLGVSWHADHLRLLSLSIVMAD